MIGYARERAVPNPPVGHVVVDEPAVLIHEMKFLY
jgi:pyrimidine deaminase RibD-like protein